MPKTRFANLSVSIVVFFLFLFPLGRCFAVCVSCTESFKLRVVLKSGKSITGYIGWNTFFNEDYPRNKSGLDATTVDVFKPFSVKGYFEEKRIVGFKECFERYESKITRAEIEKDKKLWHVMEIQEYKLWLALKTVEIQTTCGKPYNADKWTFHLYKKIQAFPGGRYAVDVKDSIKIDYNDIAKLEYVEQDLKINTTGGLSILTAEQIEAVRNKKPRFHVYNDNGVATMDLFCYDPNMTFEEFVDVISCVEEYKYSFEVRLGPVRGNYEVPQKNRDCSEWEKFIGKDGYGQISYLSKYDCVEFCEGYD